MQLNKDNANLIRSFMELDINNLPDILKAGFSLNKELIEDLSLDLDSKVIIIRTTISFYQKYFTMYTNYERDYNNLIDFISDINFIIVAYKVSCDYYELG